MCIRRETREKARRSLAFSRVSKPHTHITHMLRQCTSIVYLKQTWHEWSLGGQLSKLCLVTPTSIQDRTVSGHSFNIGPYGKTKTKIPLKPVSHIQ
jgi:hypothetical protein